MSDPIGDADRTLADRDLQAAIARIGAAGVDALPELLALEGRGIAVGPWGKGSPLDRLPLLTALAKAGYDRATSLGGGLTRSEALRFVEDGHAEGAEAASHEGNGHSGNGSKPHTSPVAPQTPQDAPTDHPDLQDALERIAEGADPHAVVVSLYPAMASGDLDRGVVEATLTAAVPTLDFPKAYSEAEAKARLQPIPRLKKNTPDHTARTYLDLCHKTPGGDQILFRYQRIFYRWDGGCYRPHEDALVEKDVWNFLALGGVEPNLSRRSNAVAGVVTHTTIPGTLTPSCWLGEPLPDYPDPADLIALKGGYLHPEGEVVLPATPRLFNLSALPFEYRIEDAAPPVEWLRILDTYWGADAENNGFANDPQSIETLQEWMGYLLSSDYRFQKILLVIGPTRSGKGIISQVIQHLLGPENIVATSLKSIGGDFGLAGFLGKSCAIIGDSRSGKGTDIGRASELLLNISGRDPVPVNAKNRPEVSATLSTKIVLMSNIVPNLIDASNALAGRFVPVVMKRSFLGEEDETLFNRLIKPEMPCILHWALAGRKRLYERHGFLVPDTAKAKMREFTEAASPITGFLNAKCHVGDGRSVGCQRLWEMWVDWCHNRKQEPGNMTWFGRDLSAAIAKVEVRRLGANRIPTYFGVGEGDGDIP
jgi:putative DNA primase/helicase